MSGDVPTSRDGVLARYLERHLPGDGPVHLLADRDGHANEMLFVRRGASEWVLRRPPEKTSLPTTMDIRREYRLLTALQRASVRVPSVVLLCEDPSVAGAPFYVMDRADGIVVRERLPDELDAPEHRRRVGEELMDALAELHAVDWRALGLEDFGRPSGYVSRMLSRWSDRLAALTASFRPLPDLDRVTSWLHEHEPDDTPHTVIHGDYHLLNVVLSAVPPVRLTAILDWEIATIGDPMVDLGWCLLFWRSPDDPGPIPMAHLNAPVAVLDGVFSGPGWMSGEQLVERYEHTTGRSVAGIPFYVVLAIWRMAIIAETSFVLATRGEAPAPGAQRFEEGVPALAAHALHLTRRAL